MPIFKNNGYTMLLEHRKGEIVGWAIYKSDTIGMVPPLEDNEIPEEVLADLIKQAEEWLKPLKR